MSGGDCHEPIMQILVSVFEFTLSNFLHLAFGQIWILYVTFQVSLSVRVVTVSASRLEHFDLVSNGGLFFPNN